MSNSAGRLDVDYLSEFALRYCTVVFFGESLAGGTLVRGPKRGTATLLAIGSRRFIVTNDHVLGAYEKFQRERGSPVHFQIGRVAIDPQSRLIARDSRLDLCTFCADDLPVTEINDRIPEDPLPLLDYYRPSTWPPALPAAGEILLWAGFPSSLRTFEEGTHWTVPLTFAGAKVTRVEDDAIISNEDPERKGWIVHYGDGLNPTSKAFLELGGMSGGPVFVIGARSQPELVGLISQYNSAVNQMRIARIDEVTPSGAGHLISEMKVSHEKAIPAGQAGAR